MEITNRISTCIIFFPYIIASAMEENNIKKNEKDYKKEKICFEIKVSSNVKKEDILSSSFWRDKIKTENYTLTLKKEEPDYKSLERCIKDFKDLKDFYGEIYTDAEKNKYIENFKENNKICTYLVEIKKDILDKLKPAEDFCDMFLWCDSIIEINGIENIINGRKVKNLKGMFRGCSSLISIESDSVWEIGDVEDLSEMFIGCENLVSLPNNMSCWDVKNVKKMKNLFYNCRALKELPDISDWNISNVTDLSGVFHYCENLIKLPDISKWDTSNVTDLSEIFYICSSLTQLPDISKWKISNVTNLSKVFYSCKKLIKLPDLSKWETQNVTDTSYMFCNCIELLQLPDISKWDMRKNKNIDNMFYNCKKLSKIPDINKWELGEKLKNFNMCSKCSSLTSLPDVQEICDSQDNVNISIKGCISLSSFPNFQGKKNYINNINAINYQ